MLLENIATEYLNAKSARLRANTLEGYESALRLHVLPRWGGVHVESIRREDVQAWVDGFEMPGAAEKAYKTLRQVIRWHIRAGAAIADPTVGVVLPARPAPTARALGERELNRVLYEARGQDWEPVVLVQAALGLRRCEACALTWSDIDLGSGLVSVTKGRHVVGGETRTWGVKTPKSARTLVLPAWAVARLREIKRGRRPAGCDLLCGERPDAISRRFAAFCRRLGIDACMMILRHTWATLAVKAGVAIEVVAMALGHTSVETCYSRYLARSVDVFRAAQRKVSALILGAAPRERLA